MATRYAGTACARPPRGPRTRKWAAREEGLGDGLGLNEGAELMKSLGAVRAMALDGGGSVTMAVNGKVINSPSERAHVVTERHGRYGL
ncbi:phosphodiester glycosidase family protein [Streptomyces longisporoflavus]|uniref:Phosphodiester glycosidase family protein n=1 Tax=Streptomyces longisporoflavus TaxID=28044 RepID=A0ABW7QNF2_9ACTN